MQVPLSLDPHNTLHASQPEQRGAHVTPSTEVPDCGDPERRQTELRFFLKGYEFS